MAKIKKTIPLQHFWPLLAITYKSSGSLEEATGEAIQLYERLAAGVKLCEPRHEYEDQIVAGKQIQADTPHFPCAKIMGTNLELYEEAGPVIERPYR